MKITRLALQNMYDCLAVLPPFDRFTLPLSHSIEFRVNQSKMAKGLYEPDPHQISISRIQHDSYGDVLMTLAHEMVHLALERRGASDHSNHDADFNKLGAEVCDFWGWNFKEF